jgi:choice-of-anchor B domain-containing protein
MTFGAGPTLRQAKIQAGTVFVDVSDPESPQYLVYDRTHASSNTWRDIKVCNNRAYIVSEASGHGMQVYDLIRLRGVTTVTEHSADALAGAFGKAHNVVVNGESARAYGVGARNLCSGGLAIFDKVHCSLSS